MKEAVRLEQDTGGGRGETRLLFFLFIYFIIHVLFQILDLLFIVFGSFEPVILSTVRDQSAPSGVFNDILLSQALQTGRFCTL